MTFASVGTIGTNSGHGAASSITLVTLSTINVGDLIVIQYGGDNLSSSTDNVDYSDVTSITDVGGNTYTKAKEVSNNNGAAAAGATDSFWYSVITAQLVPITGIITVNLNGSPVARAVNGWQYTKDAGTTISVAGSVTDVGDAVDPASVSLSSLPNQEYLFIYGLAGEQSNVGVYTPATNYTPIEWVRKPRVPDIEIAVCSRSTTYPVNMKA